MIDTALSTYGGLDIAISNAGGGFQSPMASCPDELLQASFAINFFSHQVVASRATQIMQEQGNGGALLFNVSKAALNPGGRRGSGGFRRGGN